MLVNLSIHQGSGYPKTHTYNW